MRLSARVSEKPRVPISRNLLQMLPVAVAQSASDDSAIMLCTSGFVDDVTLWCQWSRIKDGVMFRRVRQMAAPEAKLLSTNALLLF